MTSDRIDTFGRAIARVVVVCLLVWGLGPDGSVALDAAPDTMMPLLAKGHPVKWWFVFKFNAKSFPGCGSPNSDGRKCPFGGKKQDYTSFSQRFVHASDENPELQFDGSCLGDSGLDPVGATFDQIYNSDSAFYVIWNDQFYDAPEIDGCSTSCSSPWGHSKGMVAWTAAGEGVVLQVTTPSWPAAGNRQFPRRGDGNTLGCVLDNNVKVSQHFFAVRLTRQDLVEVLKALSNASVVTDLADSQIVRNGGPAEIQALVKKLGIKSKSSALTRVTLSSGVDLISKPSALHVPPWQMVSAVLGSVPLRTATWWALPQIPTTTASTKIGCWDGSLGKPGPVEIATSGEWDGQEFGLKGGPGPDFNHAKIGVSTSNAMRVAIFGDLNQQGALSGKCGSSQNGRGGLFYVLHDNVLVTNIAKLIEGETAPRTIKH